MRDAKSLPLQRARTLRFQRERQFAPQMNLLRSLAREMNAAEPMRQGPSHSERRPFIGINSAMHAKQTTLAKLASYNFLAHPLFPQFSGRPCLHEAENKHCLAASQRPPFQPVDSFPS